MDKKIAIMQPYFFPYLGYFHLINSVDKFVFYNDVNFVKKGWINRNYILLNNKPQLVNIPIVGLSQNKLICEHKILKDLKWENIFLKTIQQSYKKAPFFSEIFQIIFEIIYSDIDNLAYFNVNLIKKILHFLDIQTQIIDDSSTYKNSHLKSQDRIIDICIKENAKRYYNLPGGQELYNKELFRSQDLELNFIKGRLKPYKQFNGDFVHNLSIIDVLMFNDKKTVINYLSDFEII